MLETDISYDPTSFNVLITDISAQDLHEVISNKLNVKYLSDSKQEHDSNVDGIIHGRCFRLICTLTVKIKKKRAADMASSRPVGLTRILCSGGSSTSL